MFLLDLFFGFIGGIFAYFLIFLSNKFLKKYEDQPNIKTQAGVPMRKSSGKRTPKALTDLMAYQKEIQEQGENRV